VLAFCTLAIKTNEHSKKYCLLIIKKLPKKVLFVIEYLGIEYLGNPGDFLLPLENLFNQLITSSKFLDFCFISYQDIKQDQNFKIHCVIKRKKSFFGKFESILL